MSQPQDSGTTIAWAVGILSILGTLWVAAKRILNTVTRSELTRLNKSQDEKFLEAVKSQREDFSKSLDQQREDFLRALEEHRAERLRLHEENRSTSRETFSRISELEKGQSRIEGSLSGRFQIIPPQNQR